MVESVVQSHAEIVVGFSEKSKIRVLHVDDELGLLKVAKQCLEMQGPFRVDTASSVEEALVKLEKERYDAVVSDYQMPRKDGLEFLKELRESGNSVPFIMFTGKGREEVAIRALNLGANQYLNKTGEPETVYTELAHSITELAKARKAEQELLDSEERFRNLFEKSNDGLVFVDLSGRIMDINQKLVHMAERTKEDTVGKSFLELGLVSSKDVPVLVGRLGQNAMGKSTGSFEFEIGKENSEKKSIEINSVLILKENVPLGSLVIVRDITEHKKREEVLRESEEKYKDLFENAMDAIVTLDLKGSITAVNNSVLRFGYKREDLVGKSILDFVSKEYWPAVMRDFSKVAQGESAKNEIELAAPAGKILVEYHAGAIVRERDVVGVQVNMRDMTERKKSEELLGESEERFRDLFESIRDPVGIFVGREGRLIDYNAAFKRLSGYTDEELKGKKFLDFVHPDDHALVLEKYQTEYSEEELPLVYEIRGMNKKGESIPLEISVSTYKKKGRAIGIEVIHREITERKRYERSLSTLNIHSQKLNTAESMEEIYRLTLDAMEKTLGFEIAFFMVVDKGMLRVVDHRGYPESFSFELPLDGAKRGASVEVVRSGKPINVPDAEKEGAWVEFMPGIRSGLDVPVKIGSKVLGVIGVDSKELNAFNEKDQELLEILASHAATAISNLEYAKNLETHTHEIRESQEKFRRLFMDNPEAAVYVDSDFRVLDANPRFSELFGYSLNEIKDGHLLDLIVPESKREEGEMLDKEAKKAHTYHDTVRRRKDGTLVPVSISTAPITVGDQTVGYVGLYVDATERKRYEESLSALNTYSRDLNMAENRQEIYRLTLDAMQKVLGFEYADFMMIDKNMLYIADKRGYPEPFQLELPLDGSKKGITIKVAKTGNSVIVQDVRKNTDFVKGLPGILSELAVPIKVGQKTLGVLNVESRKLNAFDEKDQELLEILASHAATAISNLDRARELEAYAREIRESQQMFERLFIDDPEAAVHLDSSFHILNVNPRFSKLFDYSLDEVKGRHINDIIVPKDKMEEAIVFDKRASKGEIYHEDTIRKRKDGSLVSVALSAAPVIIENQVIGHIAVYKDISQLKKAEDELRKMLQKLDKMNEKLRVVGGLTRHDVRNKLSTITGNAYLLKKQMAGNSEALDKLGDMEKAVQQTVKIFDFAKAYEVLGAEELVYNDVEKTVNEAISLFANRNNIKVINDCHGLTILADSLLRQLFYNLIDNSLKYGQKTARIRVYYEKTGQDSLKLVYEDDGIGIPVAEKPKLFKEGYSTGGSTGYGLYLIKKMMEVYGWTIQETGTPGKGVHFTMAMPEKNQNDKENYRLH